MKRDDPSNRAAPGRSAPKCFRWPLLVLLLAWLSGTRTGFGGDVSLTEYQVKSLFLLNFTKYVEWPADAYAEAASPITIGLCGENKFGDDLQKAIAGKSVNGRSIVIRTVEKTEDFSKCHILFVSDSEKKRVAEIVNQVKGRPVLTVGETDQFIEQGGVINFTMKDGKVRLEINLQAARQANLQVSSKLLSVADAVKGKTK